MLCLRFYHFAQHLAVSDERKITWDLKLDSIRSEHMISRSLKTGFSAGIKLLNEPIPMLEQSGVKCHRTQCATLVSHFFLMSLVFPQFWCISTQPFMFLTCPAWHVHCLMNRRTEKHRCRPFTVLPVFSHSCFVLQSRYNSSPLSLTLCLSLDEFQMVFFTPLNGTPHIGSLQIKVSNWIASLRTL